MKVNIGVSKRIRSLLEDIHYRLYLNEEMILRGDYQYDILTELKKCFKELKDEMDKLIEYDFDIKNMI